MSDRLDSKQDELLHIAYLSGIGAGKREMKSKTCNNCSLCSHGVEWQGNFCKALDVRVPDGFYCGYWEKKS